MRGGSDPRLPHPRRGGRDQEEGAQVALSLGASPGESVSRRVRGQGNKTALLAEMVGPGAVDAADRHPQKLARLAVGSRLGSRRVAAFAVDWTVGAGRAGRMRSRAHRRAVLRNGDDRTPPRSGDALARVEPRGASRSSDEDPRHDERARKTRRSHRLRGLQRAPRRGRRRRRPGARERSVALDGSFSGRPRAEACSRGAPSAHPAPGTDGYFLAYCGVAPDPSIDMMHRKRLRIQFTIAAMTGR